MRGGAGLAGAPSGPGGRGLSRLVSACGAARRSQEAHRVWGGTSSSPPARLEVGEDAAAAGVRVVKL